MLTISMLKACWKSFGIKSIGYYHDLNIQSDIYYLQMYFKTFEIIYELIKLIFISTWLSIARLLKKTEVE